MRNTKRYSTQTFTKRVDHEGGEHRTPLNPVEPSVCERCGAVYVDRHWVAKGRIAGAGANKHKHWRPANLTVCPGCRQIEEGVSGGYVSLSGAFLKTHREEIERLLRNEEQRAKEDNPLSVVIKWVQKDDEQLRIETTTEHLAQRFGRALEKAFKGEVRYDFSHENKVARVHWHRD